MDFDEVIEYKSCPGLNGKVCGKKITEVFCTKKSCSWDLYEVEGYDDFVDIYAIQTTNEVLGFFIKYELQIIDCKRDSVTEKINRIKDKLKNDWLVSDII